MAAASASPSAAITTAEPFSAVSYGRQALGDMTANGLEHLAVAEDCSRVHRHGACMTDVDGRLVQDGTWLPVRFCLWPVSGQPSQGDAQVTECLLQIPGHVEDVGRGNGLCAGMDRILSCA